MALKKIIAFSLILATGILFSACGEAQKSNPASYKFDAYYSKKSYNPGSGWKLYWAEEFVGDKLNEKFWNYDIGDGGWGNEEFQYYTSGPTNIYVSNGNLVIRANRYEDTGLPYFNSARITTYNKFNFLYGKIVARMRLPTGKGAWPAFWMMGQIKENVGWPRCGELDIVEMRGGDTYGESVCGGNIHWQTGDGRHGQNGASIINQNPFVREETPYPLYLDYHYYELEWNEKEVIWRLDGKEFHRVDISGPDFSAFRTPFYILLNLAVGGTYTKLLYTEDATGPFPIYMYVDWIRIYQKN